MNIKIIGLSILLLSSFVYRSQAAYLRNVPQQRLQPDGTVLHCLATGDEFHNWLHDSRHFTIIQDPSTGFFVYATLLDERLVPTDLIAGRADPAAAGLRPGLNLDPEERNRLRNERIKGKPLKGAAAVSTTGSINNIVIFIRFSDQPEFTGAVSTYQSAFNDPASASMHAYFLEVSKSSLTIGSSFYPEPGGATVISYQDEQERNYYCKYNEQTNPIGYVDFDDSRTREMELLRKATEAVAAQVEAAGLNLDHNGDGYVDNICYVIQGAAEGWGELLWPHAWQLDGVTVRISGLRVWDFNMQLSESLAVNVLAHEMSHTIGFPDLYRYNDDSIDPVGEWDIMSSFVSTPQHYSVYAKHKYGKWFNSIPEITASGNYSLSPVNDNAYAGYIIRSPNSSSDYFVLEYRRSTGLFESGLPGSGLIIYRVDPSLDGNSQGPPDEVYVFRKDGTSTTDGNTALAFFSSESGRTAFGSGTNPSCFLSDGSPGGIAISDIGTAGTTITFTVNLDIGKVLTVTPGSREVPGIGGTGTFTVSNTGAGIMDWSAAVTTGASWLHITSGNQGTNAGTVNFTADVNPDNASRTGTITITAPGAENSPAVVTILQAANPPILSVTPSALTMDYRGGNGSFTVANTGGGTIAWTAAVGGGSAWIHIISGATGTNGGTISITADANPDNSVRTGTITVNATGGITSSKTVSVIQEANAPVISVVPIFREVESGGGAATFEVSNSGGGTLSWTAAVEPGISWIHVVSGSAGSNSGTVGLSVDTNPEDVARTGILWIEAPGAVNSPLAVTIAQAANSPALVVFPSSRSIGFQTGNTSFEIENSGGGTLVWQAAVTTGDSWLTITSGTGGSNAGTIIVTADLNPGIPYVRASSP
jgi:M6 family metalloprotease-like protein